MFTRRHALQSAACGFGYLALAGLAHADQVPLSSPGRGGRGEGASTRENPLAPKPSHHAPKAKRVIFLFMQGGPSQVDTFDYKPQLAQRDGQQMPFDDARTIANTGQRQSNQRIMKPLWKFSQHGQSGRQVSALFPHVAKHVDDLCFLHGLHTEGVAHGPATLFLHTGSTNMIRPSMGSWITYGLGTENANLPGFVTIAPSPGNGGARNYGNAFLPSVYQGTALGTAGGSTDKMVFKHLANKHYSMGEQEQFLGLLGQLNAEQLARQPGDKELEAVVQSYELAWRMQQQAPDVLDLRRETPETLALYGIGQKETDDFGRQCLMARRLCEAGVRFIQVTHGDASANPKWDQHSNLAKHADHAKSVDQPIAGLLTDLKRRGLLDDTLIWWGGEFGRTPYAEKNGSGRDHNPGGFTVWLAGAGVKPGFAFGATDDFGHHAIRDKVHMHDLHATILHLLGLDHEKLTFQYAGRPFRLTDVHGRVVREIIG
ncbi:MAG: DUF1501 domain-containing protein [Gemmatales bacterium]